MLKFGPFRKHNVARTFGIYILSNYISVIPGGWKGEHEGLCMMKRHLGMAKSPFQRDSRPRHTKVVKMVLAATRLALRLTG